MTRTVASAAASGKMAGKLTLWYPPLGRATARKQARPTAEQMTPASMTRSGRASRDVSSG